MTIKWHKTLYNVSLLNIYKIILPIAIERLMKNSVFIYNLDFQIVSYVWESTSNMLLIITANSAIKLYIVNETKH